MSPRPLNFFTDRMMIKLKMRKISKVHGTSFNCLKYLGFILKKKKGTDSFEHIRKVVNGRKMEGAIKSLVNANGFSVECFWVFHEVM